MDIFKFVTELFFSRGWVVAWFIFALMFLDFLQCFKKLPGLLMNTKIGLKKAQHCIEKGPFFGGTKLKLYQSTMQELEFSPPRLPYLLVLCESTTLKEYKLCTDLENSATQQVKSQKNFLKCCKKNNNKKSYSVISYLLPRFKPFLLKYLFSFYATIL